MVLRAGWRLGMGKEKKVQTRSGVLYCAGQAGNTEGGFAFASDRARRGLDAH